jgi:hypothetical protein
MPFGIVILSGKGDRMRPIYSCVFVGIVRGGEGGVVICPVTFTTQCSWRNREIPGRENSKNMFYITS